MPESTVKETLGPGLRQEPGAEFRVSEGCAWEYRAPAPAGRLPGLWLHPLNRVYTIEMAIVTIYFPDALVFHVAYGDGIAKIQGL